MRHVSVHHDGMMVTCVPDVNCHLTRLVATSESAVSAMLSL